MEIQKSPIDRDEDAIKDELEEMASLSSRPASDAQRYAMAMAIASARLAGASEEEIFSEGTVAVIRGATNRKAKRQRAKQRRRERFLDDECEFSEGYAWEEHIYRHPDSFDALFAKSDKQHKTS